MQASSGTFGTSIQIKYHFIISYRILHPKGIHLPRQKRFFLRQMRMAEALEQTIWTSGIAVHGLSEIARQCYGQRFRSQ